MSYKTEDGYTLQDGDECYVNCLMSDEDASYQIFRAIYRSENAIEMGWDFEIPDLEVEEAGVVQVWKNKPEQEKDDLIAALQFNLKCANDTVEEQQGKIDDLKSQLEQLKEKIETLKVELRIGNTLTAQLTNKCRDLEIAVEQSDLMRKSVARDVAIEFSKEIMALCEVDEFGDVLDWIISDARLKALKTKYGIEE